MHRPVVWGAGRSATEEHEGDTKFNKEAKGRYFLTE